MKNYTPEVGDLICYNAAGMRKHSLGLVLELRRELPRFDAPDKVPFVYIQWVEKPTKPPRSEFRSDWRYDREGRWTDDETVAGWYRDFGCFEVIEKK